MMLLIDNYDSFTYNLAHLFGALGVEVRVLRNDELTAQDAEQLGATQLVVSPGPGRPADAGASIEIIKRARAARRRRSACASGIRRSSRRSAARSGTRASCCTARRAPCDTTAPGSSPACRSRSTRGGTTPSPRRAFRTSSCRPRYADDGEVMAVRHRELPIVGVQFHPESVLTPDGPALARNFLEGNL